MQFAITFVVSLLVAVGILVTRWRKRPATRPATVTGSGWATVALGAAATLTALPMVTAALSIVLSGLGLIAGALALTQRDTHRWTIVGLCLVALPTAFWLFFIVGEFTFPH